MNSGRNSTKLLGKVGGFVVLTLIMVASEGDDIIKYVRKRMDPSYRQIYTDIRAQKYQGDLYAENGKEYWSVTATAHNQSEWPEEMASLYYGLSFYDEDESYLEMTEYPGQGEVSGEENMYTDAAMEFLPPGMEHEMHFLVAVPEGADRITCSFYDEDYTEQSVELQLEL